MAKIWKSSFDRQFRPFGFRPRYHRYAGPHFVTRPPLKHTVDAEKWQKDHVELSLAVDAPTAGWSAVPVPASPSSIKPYDDSRHLHPHWHCVCLRARWRCPCGPRRRHPSTRTGQTRDQPPRWRCACLRWRARCECGLAWWRASMPACHADQQPPSWRWSCPITRPAVQADHCATTHEQSLTLRAPPHINIIR